MIKNFINKKRASRLIFLMGIFLLLTGCTNISQTYNQFIEDRASDLDNQSSSTSQEESVEEDTTDIDIRLVPEYNQVIQSFSNLENVTMGDAVYETATPFSHEQETFNFTVNRFSILEVEDASQELASQFNFEENPGAIVVMHVLINNPSQSSIYFPVEELTLRYRESSQQSYPSTDLYPLASGNLYEILQTSQGEIGPEMTVEGYLVYGLGETVFEEAKEQEHLMLSMNPPSLKPNSIIAVDGIASNQEIPLFLPLSEETEQALLNNQQMLDDRLTTEWWGNKTLLADDVLNLIDEEKDVQVELTHVQVTDFEPFDYFQEAFQNFPNGQVIVTIEYTVTNNSEEILLPIDGDANLVINGDDITSDYGLINQLYGETLEPGESMRVIKAFALDKTRYYEAWQGSDYYLALNVPTTSDEEGDGENESDDNTTDDFESTHNEQDTNLGSNIYYFDFTFSPNLINFVDEDMSIIDSPPANLQESDEDEQVNDDKDEIE